MGRRDSLQKTHHSTRLNPKIHTIYTQTSNTLTIQGNIGGIPTSMLIDTGSSLTLINSHLLSKLDPFITKNLRPPPFNIHLQLADKSPLYISHTLKLPVTIDNITQSYTVYIAPRLSRNCIIGNNFIKQNNLQIDGGNQYVYYKRPIRKQVRQFQQINKETKKTNELSYILRAAKQVIIPPYHAYNIHVKPNIPFVSTTNNENEEYELRAYSDNNKEHQRTPYVANRILVPQKSLHIKATNLSKSAITILVGQKLAIMSRRNRKQINAINHLTTTDIRQVTDTSNNDKITNVSNTNLSDDQRKHLQQPMEKCPDVFTRKPAKINKVKQVTLVDATHLTLD